MKYENAPSSFEIPSAIQNLEFPFPPLPPVQNSAPGSTLYAPCPGSTSSLAPPTSNLPTFTILQPDWLQLSPYGDFPHARGLQRVDRTASETMVHQFNSFRARAGRLFGGAPFYVGHPDLASAHELADCKAYGWVMQLEARDDGLYGQVKWSQAGLDLLKNAHYKYLSPYWEGKQIGTQNGKPIFQPIALLSVGLTNTPNIPVRPLANEFSAPVAASLQGALLLSPSAYSESSVVTPPSSVTSVPLVVKNLIPSHFDPRPSNLPCLHTRSITENIALRRGELVPMHNRRQRIHNAVKSKMRLGLKYNTAWEEVKQEHQDWFANES